ncbi:MAG TPA: hypothetical protein VK859_07335 [bacterium]|jgi:hypothetical protein|nr:hypothetical protein [bacterium]
MDPNNEKMSDAVITNAGAAPAEAGKAPEVKKPETGGPVKKNFGGGGNKRFQKGNKPPAPSKRF